MHRPIASGRGRSLPRALLLFEPPDGGAPEVVLNLALGIERHGFEVLVAGPERASIRARLAAAGVDYAAIAQLERRSRSPLAEARALRRAQRELDALLAREPIDVIHCHSSKAGVIGRLAGRRRGIPVVYTPHCFAFLRDVSTLKRMAPAAVERALAPLTSAFVCVCESERQAAMRLSRRARERTRRIYNGVPAQTANGQPANGQRTGEQSANGQPAGRQPAALAEQALLDFRGEGMLVGAVTVLRRQKRLDILLEAVPRVLAEVPAARFAIIGNGPMRAQLQEQASALGLEGEPRFRFFDFTPPSDRYMSVLDLYVLSSAWEAMPMGILEALSWGVPQVVTDVGGTVEAVTPQTGRLVPAKQPAALATAIVELLQSPQTLADARTASRARHRELFDIERMVDETVGVYRGLLHVRDRWHLRPDDEHQRRGAGARGWSDERFVAPSPPG